MKTQARTFTNTTMLALLGLASLAMTGCILSGKDSDSGDTAVVQGRLQGDAEVSGSSETSGWDSATVTSHEVNADGSLSAALDSTRANGDGTFSLKTHRTGHHVWILRARRGAEEWMTRFEGDLSADAERTCRPMNLESSTEASTWLELQKTSEGREVSYSEVTLAIDANVAASGRGAYRGAESARNELSARLAASVKAASQARRAFLAEAEAQYESNRARIDSAHAAASLAFDASLYAAGNDTAASRAAERAYLNATLSAYLQGNVQRTDYARSAEASYHAMVRASAALSDSARTAMARNYARVMVIASDTATRNEFRGAGSSEARVQLAAQASARFRSWIDSAKSRSSMDSAMAHFRAEARAAFSDTTAGSDTTSSGFLTILTQLNVSVLLDSLSSSLQAELNASADAQGMGEAYAENQAEARSELMTRFAAVGDGNQRQATANLMAFLMVRANHD
jgi:hypothetical protein